MPKTHPWGVTFPQADVSLSYGWFGYTERELSDREREILQFETAQSAVWRDANGYNWTAFHLTWPKDKRFNDTDMAHNPTRCLPAIGLELEKKLPAVKVEVGESHLEFQGWRFDHQGSQVYAFLVNRREREPEKIPYVPSENNIVEYLRRLEKISRGNRSNPLEMLELVVQGPRSDAEAIEALKSQVGKLIRN